MNFLLFVGLLLSGTVFAHTEFLLSTQHISITRSQDIGRQHELSARHDINHKTALGLSGTYLERFSFYEKRMGAFLVHKFNDRLTLDGRYFLGEGDNEILPREQRQLSAYYALAPGYTPYFTYRDHRYSVTRVHMLTAGMEIEKFPHIILIPQVMSGQATFQSPADTENVYSYGLRAMYYEEKKFNAFIFGYQGREASQGILGRSNVVVDTRSGGFGGSWYFTDSFRTEFVFDHTNYHQLKNQFITTTLNFFWTVDS